MAAYDIPDDLIKLKAAFFAADEHCRHLGGLKLPASDFPVIVTEYDDARRERIDLVMAIHRHDWWATVDNRNAADVVLVAAAKAFVI